jgi:hypothetical protein
LSDSLIWQARRTIHTVQYLTVATIDEHNRPWNAPVYTAFDDHYRFFWISDGEGQHSRNIRNNPDVFLTLFDSTIPPGTGAGQGVYIRATAYELSDPSTVERALGLVTDRAGGARRDPGDYLRDDYPGRVYQATPEKIWVNDSTERFGARVDVRVDINLTTLRTEYDRP